jgi:hypothetical protein
MAVRGRDTITLQFFGVAECIPKAGQYQACESPAAMLIDLRRRSLAGSTSPLCGDCTIKIYINTIYDQQLIRIAGIQFPRRSKNRSIPASIKARSLPK